MPKPISPSTRAEALELRRDGWSCVDAAAALGVSPQAVGRWSKAAGVKVRACGKTVLKTRIVEDMTTHTAAFTAIELDRAWPMPIGFPPVVAIPRTAHASE